MTTAMKDLKKGTHYDGFMFHSGKQRGVATLYWNGEHFVDLLGPVPHVDDPKDRSWKWSFEPNVVGKKDT